MTERVNQISKTFFNDDCVNVSKRLLGKILVRKVKTERDGADEEEVLLKGRIVEVEAYYGSTDAAAHSYMNKCSKKNEAMYMKPGTIYVYNIYGLYCCLNVIPQSPVGSGILIRAVEPLSGIDYMKKQRPLIKQAKQLTNGPSKLCLAFKITKDEFNKENVFESEKMWIEDEDDDEDENENERNQHDIVESKRIGIQYAGEEAIEKLYRFYINNNQYVSKK